MFTPHMLIAELGQGIRRIDFAVNEGLAVLLD
jgi:hypothetical protein